MRRNVEQIRVIIVEPSKHPYTAMINKDLLSMQRIVGGNIKVVDCNKEGIAVIVNATSQVAAVKEGNYIGEIPILPINKKIRLSNGRLDFLCGTFFLVKQGEEGFDNIPIEQVSRLKKEFKRKWIDWSRDNETD